MNKIPAFYFPSSYLKQLANLHRSNFLTARPFPYIVIDRFVPDDILDIVSREFPTPDQMDWKFSGPGTPRHTGNKYIEKIELSDESKFGIFTRHFMQQLNSITFIEFIEQLTGTQGIIPDPSYNGCGLHSTGRGGRLLIHTDTNRHPIEERLHQRFNLILFLNKDWKEEYRGHLELWD